MRTARWIAAGLLVVAFVWISAAYRHDIMAARGRLEGRSDIARTKCGSIEYATRGEGPPLLVVHGAGGGFDQGLILAEGLPNLRIIAPSRFGYLRTPLPADASAEAQADAHACLLDTLGVERAAVIGVSAGGPSALQFCLRHADRCAALVLLVPMAYPFETAPRASPSSEWIMQRSLDSDFLFWAALKLMPDRMTETVLGTPIAAVRAAPAAEQRRLQTVLDSILPVTPRAKGLLNEGAVARTMRPLPLEQIAVPTLVASARDDGYRTFSGAKYTAEHIPGARFIGYETGGHMLVGHDAEFHREMLEFLEHARLAIR